MKRIIPLILAALLLCACGAPPETETPTFPPLAEATPVQQTQQATAAPVETDAPQQDGSFWTKLDPAAAMQADLDGDGTAETVTVTVNEDAYTTDVTVEGAAGTLTDHLDTALMFLKAYYGDAKAGDGSRELYLTGDEASDDYATYAYRIVNGALQRTDIFGEAVDCDGETVTIRRATDVLGTYDSTCKYALQDGEFRFRPVSPFTIARYEGDWADRVLTLQKDGLPVQTTAGETTLQKGTELMLTETDQESYAVLVDRQGNAYRISMEKPADDWRWFIGGVAEGDWFGELLYAG